MNPADPTRQTDLDPRRADPTPAADPVVRGRCLDIARLPVVRRLGEFGGGSDLVFPQTRHHRKQHRPKSELSGGDQDRQPGRVDRRVDVSGTERCQQPAKEHQEGHQPNGGEDSRANDQSSLSIVGRRSVTAVRPERAAQHAGHRSEPRPHRRSGSESTGPRGGFGSGGCGRGRHRCGGGRGDRRHHRRGEQRLGGRRSKRLFDQPG